MFRYFTLVKQIVFDCQKIIKYTVLRRHRLLPKLPDLAFLAAGPFVFLLSFLRLFVAFGVVEITLKKPSSLPCTEVFFAF